MVDWSGNFPQPAGTSWEGKIIQGECELKFAYAARDLDREPFSERIQRLAKRLWNAGTPPSSTKLKQCAREILIGDMGNEGVDALAQMICCKSFQERRIAGNGDPCGRGTANGDRPGQRPRRWPCWKPSETSSPPPPGSIRNECCDFLACRRAMTNLFKEGGGLFRDKTGREEHNECFIRCINNR